MAKQQIYVDYKEFARSSRKIQDKEFPQKIVNAFSELAYKGARRVRIATRSKFKLHSRYIPNAIKSIPLNEAQKSAAQKAVRRYGDVFAAVYLRGANTPKRSMDFMALHEEGGIKKPHEGRSALAIPTTTLKRKPGFKTAKGRVRKRWKPNTLLEKFKSRGSVFNGQTTTNKGIVMGPQSGRVPGHAFIIAGKGGTPMIARRKTRRGDRNLEFLYALENRAKIKRRWDFESNVWKSVRSRYDKVIIKYLGTMKTK